MTPTRMVLPPVGAVIMLAAWWGTVAALDVPTFFLPAPPEVAHALVGYWPHLLRQVAVTLGHTMAGFTIAAAAAVAAAIIMAGATQVREMMLPLLVAVQAMPVVAFAPLLVIWLGFGHPSKIAMVVLICYFPILIATLTGLRSTPAELIELARSLSTNRWRTFTTFRIPYALPQAFTGLKLGITLALVGAVVAQLATPNAGLGAVIVRASQATNTPLVFAAIGLLAALGNALFYTLAALERLTLPWAQATTR